MGEKASANNGTFSSAALAAVGGQGGHRVRKARPGHDSRSHLLTRVATRLITWPGVCAWPPDALPIAWRVNPWAATPVNPALAGRPAIEVRRNRPRPPRKLGALVTHVVAVEPQRITCTARPPIAYGRVRLRVWVVYVVAHGFRSLDNYAKGDRPAGRAMEVADEVEGRARC